MRTKHLNQFIANVLLIRNNVVKGVSTPFFDFTLQILALFNG